MRVCYFDTIGGISGDMALGALVNAGVPLTELSDALKSLNIPGFELEARHIERSGIVATKVDVVLGAHDHHHRHLSDIETIIDGSGLTGRVKERSKKIFREVAIAEAKVHNVDIAEVHFHEVGALDSLADIVGVAVCLEMLGIEAVYSSPMKVGRSGLVDSQHGKLPVPTPATMEILRGYPLMFTEAPYELTTPTGAAIIKALSSGVLATELLSTEAIGYGAGSREIEQLPNLLRVVIGTLDPDYRTDELVSVETNIDDMNPEIYPYVVEQLLAAGANDAYLAPIQMKKGRPGMLLSVLVSRLHLDAILAVIFRETTTLGVRLQPVERRKLQRSQRRVRTSLGMVTVKAVIRDGREELAAEFEDCRRIATEKNMALVDVIQQVDAELKAKPNS